MKRIKAPFEIPPGGLSPVPQIITLRWPQEKRPRGVGGRGAKTIGVEALVSLPFRARTKLRKKRTCLLPRPSRANRGATAPKTQKVTLWARPLGHKKGLSKSLPAWGGAAKKIFVFFGPGGGKS